MQLPHPDDLNAMAQLIAGDQTYFEDLGPEARIQVIQLCNQVDLAAKVNGIGETLKDINKTLEDIETDTTHIGRWFELSKLWEGR